jgi:hypothetical protein
MTKAADEAKPDALSTYATRHLRFGWWALLAYLTLGIALESMNGFKLGWYLDVSNEARRTLLTLAHAHGVLLALLNIALALTLNAFAPRMQSWARVSSPLLIAATLLLPGGFLLGGLWIYDGDPGVGILLTPIGAALAFIAVALTARSIDR